MKAGPPPYIKCDISTIPFREELKRKAKQARLRRTWPGKLKEFIFTTGIRPFFDKDMSGLLLSMSLAMSPSSCNMEIGGPLLYAESISALSNQGSVMCLLSIMNQ